MDSELPTAVYAIWWAVLLVVALVIVPLAVLLLHRTLRAALSIRLYLDEMLTAGVGIAGNTHSISALNDTLGTASKLVASSGSIKQHTGTIAAVLTERAARGRSA